MRKPPKSDALNDQEPPTLLPSWGCPYLKKLYVQHFIIVQISENLHILPMYQCLNMIFARALNELRSKKLPGVESESVYLVAERVKW